MGAWGWARAPVLVGRGTGARAPNRAWRGARAPSLALWLGCGVKGGRRGGVVIAVVIVGVVAALLPAARAQPPDAYVVAEPRSIASTPVEAISSSSSLRHCTNGIQTIHSLYVSASLAMCIQGMQEYMHQNNGCPHPGF